jgi:transcriptional regulator with XRE-family HTH domain
MDGIAQARQALVALRKRRGLTQQQFAGVLGVRSKVYVSQLETGACPFTIELALKVDGWSGGEIKAPNLLSEELAFLLHSFARTAIAAGPASLANPHNSAPT